VRRCCQDAYAYSVDRETDSTRSNIVWFELVNGNRIFVLYPPPVDTSWSAGLRASAPSIRQVIARSGSALKQKLMQNLKIRGGYSPKLA